MSEKKLVPDWVNIETPGIVWSLGQDPVLVSGPLGDVRAHQADGMTYEQWCSLWPAIAWAKENGRLPTREDEAKAALAELGGGDGK